jgi:hypothetical protein
MVLADISADGKVCIIREVPRHVAISNIARRWAGESTFISLLA